VTGNAEVVFEAPILGRCNIEVNCLEIVGKDAYFSPAPPFTCHTFHTKPQFAVQGNTEIH
jgi:hypothetical protein